jgi:hypothetical protein
MFKSLKTVIYCCLATLILFYAVEFGSLATLEFERYLNGNTGPDPQSKLTSSNEDPFVSNPQILKDHSNKPWGIFGSYALYHNYPNYHSHFLNHDEFGYRVNGNVIDKKVDRTLTVWMVGSSALYGSPNLADTETLPSYVERTLNLRFPQYKITVRNFAVPASKALQDFLIFSKELRYAKPDLLITFNGFNDLVIKNEKLIWRSGVVHNQLDYYFNFHLHNGIVNWPMLVTKAWQIAPNTMELMRKAVKFFRLRHANANIETWKRQYGDRKRQSYDKYKKTFQAATENYLLNTEALLALAKARSIRTIIVHQPLMDIGEKVLVPWEESVLKHSGYKRYALDEKTLNDLKYVESFYLDNKWMLDRNQMRRAYLTQIAETRNLTLRYDTTFIDAQLIADQLNNQPVYWDAVHMSAGAIQVIGDQISDAATKIFSE